MSDEKQNATKNGHSGSCPVHFAVRGAGAFSLDRGQVAGELEARA